MTRSWHLLHPRRRRLQAWLDADEVSSDRLTAHVETCARCAAKLDDLALESAVEPAEQATATPALATALRDVWRVPETLPDRISRAIDQRARAQRELELLLGLVSISKDTAELLLPQEPTDEEDSS